MCDYKNQNKVKIMKWARLTRDQYISMNDEHSINSTSLLWNSSLRRPELNHERGREFELQRFYINLFCCFEKLCFYVVRVWKINGTIYMRVTMLLPLSLSLFLVLKTFPCVKNWQSPAVEDTKPIFIYVKFGVTERKVNENW